MSQNREIIKSKLVFLEQTLVKLEELLMWWHGNDGEFAASSAEAIRFLAENHVITKDQSVRLVQMVKFRNRIVHIYQGVNDNQVYEILQKDLEDFTTFVSAIVARFLK